jgi:protocatechuate 3,4-dioxygenase beta subunit
VLDFWQADGSGSYDNSGFRLRGHQSTDAGGAYTLTTVVPGEYPGRTEHIHVKVAAAGRPVLTTQLFFPGVARNSSDSIFDPALLVRAGGSATGKIASFDFVLQA